MTKDDVRAELRRQFVELKNLSFPEAPDDPLLAEWWNDLHELDTYYAGLAQSVGQGSSPPLNSDLYNLSQTKNVLESIEVHSNQDRNILEHCRQYYQHFEKIDQLLRKLSGKIGRSF